MAYDGLIADEPLNGYVCFFKGKRIEVYAATSYGAQAKVAGQLGLTLRQRRDISVVLAEKAGAVVEQSPASL